MFNVCRKGRGVQDINHRALINFTKFIPINIFFFFSEKKKKKRKTRSGGWVGEERTKPKGEG